MLDDMMARKAMLDALVRFLPNLQGKPVGRACGVGQWLVRHNPDPNQPSLDVYWLMTDNGGELNLWKVNSDWETMQSVPYTASTVLVDAATMLYRVGQVLFDEPIRYDVSWAEDLDVLLAVTKEG